MSTPDLVIDQPLLPVTFPELNAHQCALLVRALDLRLEVLRGLDEAGAFSAAAMFERAEPVKWARVRIAAALGAWCRTQGQVRAKGDDELEARWPDGLPPVSLGELSLAEVWQTRLALDVLALAEFDRARESGVGTSAASARVLQDLYALVLGALRDLGVDPE